MANRRVSIWKYVKIGKVWRYCKPLVGANGKIKPHWVLVGGVPSQHPEGNYYVQFNKDGKQVWKKVGNNPAQALHEAEFQESYFKAVNIGVPVTAPDNKIPLMVSYTLNGFLEEYKLSQRPESYALMKQTLNEFNQHCGRNIIGQITRLDLLKYKAWLIARGRSPRTAGNKMLRVNQYLRTVQKLKPGEGLVTVKDAKFVELEPEVYDTNELEAFFSACTPFETVVFRTLLMSGLRKQELESLTWDDVSFVSGTITVSPKPGFSPKDWEQRTVEVPATLLTLIESMPRNSKWIFATKTGNRYTHMWDDCKKIGKLANIKGAHPHKFRATYATKLLQSGIDLKTVQKLLGHKNLESTMRYLAKAQSAEVREKVNLIWA